MDALKVLAVLAESFIEVGAEAAATRSNQAPVFSRVTDLVLCSVVLSAALIWAGWLVIWGGPGTVILLWIMALPIAGIMGFYWWRAFRVWRRG